MPLKRIFYLSDETRKIVFKRRIEPLIRWGAISGIEVLDFDKSELSGDVLIVLAVTAKTNLFKKRVLNSNRVKVFIYDNTNDISHIIKPTKLNLIKWQVKSLSKAEKHPYLMLKDYIKICDLVITGSQLQSKNIYELTGKKSIHLVDPISKKEYGRSKKVHTEKNLPVIFWEGTAPSSLQLATIVLALISVYNQAKYKLVIFSDRSGKEKQELLIKKIKDKIKDFEFVTWEQNNFQKMHLTADIAIAPIDINSSFNFSKPFNKVLSYWAFALPVVVSKIPSYQEIVKDGVNGYLCSDRILWETSLLRLIRDHKLREELGNNGFKYAWANHNSEQFAREYFGILNDLLID